jgi:triacylglycerol lipase
MIKPTTLILDGIFGRPRRFSALQKALRESCGPAELFHYNCTGLIPFEELGQQLATTIHQIATPVNIVAFSMGGIVARTARLLDSAIPIERAVFINSPHRGSWLAYALPFPGVKQLRPKSALMKRLANSPWPIPTLAIWCPGDLVVIPGRSAKLSGASETIRCDIPLHPWPVWSPRLRREIIRFLGNVKECHVEVSE